MFTPPSLLFSCRMPEQGLPETKQTTDLCLAVAVAGRTQTPHGSRRAGLCCWSTQWHWRNTLFLHHHDLEWQNHQIIYFLFLLFHCLQQRFLFPSLLLIPQGEELESFFQHMCSGFFFSCETSEKPVLTTILMQDSRDELYWWCPGCVGRTQSN